LQILEILAPIIAHNANPCPVHISLNILITEIGPSIKKI